VVPQLYWRIGLTFVAFVVVILITQGLILRYTISNDDVHDPAAAVHCRLKTASLSVKPECQQVVA
jgi:hypothetical protein